MTYTERIRYQASWGDWYVQVQFETGEIVELKFDHEPTSAEVEPLAQQAWLGMQPPEPVIEIVAEDGTIL